MSQCVPSWDIDDNPSYPPRLRSRSNTSAPDVPMLDYEVAELTWENGQLAMHGLGPPRVAAKPVTISPTPNKDAWEKPRASGTLESIVNQATCFPHTKPPFVTGGGNNDVAPWFDQHRGTVSAASSATMTMDALVPCSNRADNKERTTQVMDTVPARAGLGGGGATCLMECSARVGSCSGPAEEVIMTAGKPTKVARVPVAPEWSSRDVSVSGSATFGRDSQHMSMTYDTCDRDMGVGFTSTSMGSPENTSTAKPCTKTTTTTAADDHDSVCHSRPHKEAGDEEEKKKGTGKSSTSTKRSRAAAIHNQSERKRRDKINQRMKTLQKLVPNSSKTDKASMLDEVIEYLKQLQAQVHMMSRMNMSPMMLPMALQQQLQMSMMAPMSMGMGMGMGMNVMEMNAALGRSNMTAGISPAILSNPFMSPMTAWDHGSGERLQVSPPAVMTDPLSTFLACQSQPMTMDAYSRMAAMYQQLQQQPPASSSKN